MTTFSDEEKKDLARNLAHINKDVKWVGGVLDTLKEDSEKLKMLQWIKMRKNISRMDVELKVLEITEPRYKANREQ